MPNSCSRFRNRPSQCRVPGLIDRRSDFLCVLTTLREMVFPQRRKAAKKRLQEGGEAMTQLDLQKNKLSRGICSLSLVIVLIAAPFARIAAQQPARDVAKVSARPTRDWVRDGVIYEIY